MAKLLADYRTKLDQVLEDLAARLDQPKKDAAITEAVSEHSRHRPHAKVADVAGDGATFDIPLGAAGGVPDWQEGFSVVRQVEYPAGEREPILLERDAWREYVTPTGRVLRLHTITPQTGETVRISYAILHTVSALAGTIPDADFDSVVNLAGSIAAHMLAMSFAQAGDSTIAADSVDHKSKSAEYAARARDLRGLYFRHMGITDEKGAAAASVTADWGRTPGDQEYLTHPKGSR